MADVNLIAWTQKNEPSIAEQEVLHYPMLSEQPMYLFDFLTEMTDNHPAYYYHVDPLHQDQLLKPITAIQDIPVDRSFLVKLTYHVHHPKRICVNRTTARGTWNDSCLVPSVTEHTGYLLFYLTDATRNRNYMNYVEYTCLMTYYDGSAGNYRIVYEKKNILASEQEWGHLLANQMVWINPEPINVRFLPSDPDVVTKTRSHRIPVIRRDQNTGYYGLEVV